MQTHTIRNKSSTTPILSLTPSFLKTAKNCHTESVCLMLAWFQQEYKAATGKKISLDYEQKAILLEKTGMTENGQWHSEFSTLPPAAFKMKVIFEQGLVHKGSDTLDNILEIAETFYKMLSVTYLNAAPKTPTS